MWHQEDTDPSDEQSYVEINPSRMETYPTTEWRRILEVIAASDSPILLVVDITSFLLRLSNLFTGC